MKEYLAQWQHLDGTKGSEDFSDLDVAKSIICQRINLIGGLGCIVRVRDWVTVYRLWNANDETRAAA